MTEKRATERREVALPNETREPGAIAPDGEGDDRAPAWEGYSLETLISLLDA